MIAVIGIGSPFAGDSLGLQLVEQLKLRFANQPEVTFKLLDRPGPLLLEAMRGFDRVLLVDALLGEPPGTLRVLAIDDLLDNAGGVSSHAFGVAETLALGRQLAMLPANLTVWGIGAAPDAAPDVRELERLAGQLLQRLTGWLQNRTAGSN